MKRILAIILLLVMCLTPLTVFGTEGSVPVTEDGGTGNITVVGKYVEEDAPQVICVSLTWENMTFTYNVDAEWDYVNHVDKYVNGEWAVDSMDIGITNDSNQSIRPIFRLRLSR